jgi:hypothetical protein
VPSPDPGWRSNVLGGVAVIAANDIWAVGTHDHPDRHAYTLIEHWDGSSWSIVPSPNVGSINNNLHGVAAVATNDIWAVGTYDTNTTHGTLILHWNGTQWQVVPSPSPGSGDNILYDVAALAADDVWAVGVYSTLDGSRTLVLHWDGSQWRLVPSPNYTLIQNELRGIVARTPTDLWAVGTYRWSTGLWYTLIMHWDGQAWSLVPSPNVNGGDSLLYAVAARAADDVWAVGGGANRTLTAHWDGTGWRTVPSPNGPNGGGYLFGVATLEAGDVWAVGYTVGATLALHWDGSTWRVVSSPSPGSGLSIVQDIGALATQDVWAVGDYIGFDQRNRTLVAHYTDPCQPAPPTWTPTASPTVTGTRPTATPTPTNCPIQFSDVPPTNPFYPFVRCLACRGIISGYADGTFRWGNEVTRGQLSKIITGAAALTNVPPSTQQTFEDVPNSNVFWLFIEELAGVGAIAGYTCGGVGEPCVPPGNRPYFRWGANATRGQISKITAVTAGWNGPIPTTQQTFADVPPGHPFWTWIEELAGRGVISGYACGGAGEPCDPTHRAYFRWGANTTRGQLSKIAANTFFPNCQTPTRP